MKIIKKVGCLTMDYSTAQKLEAEIATNPKILSNYFNLKSLYVALGSSRTKIIRLLEDALVHFPDDIKLLVEIASVYEFEIEDYAKAIHYYEKVLAIDSEHRLALDALNVLKVFKKYNN